MKKKLILNLLKFKSFNERYEERVNKFCKTTKISPKLNSIAEKIKKKNDKDKIVRLSYINPIIIVIKYKVIHNNSAVSNKFKVLEVLNKTFNKIKKNQKNKIFKSPTTNNFIHIHI